MTEVTCSSCGTATTVPFTPTPGRPVYCRDCFAKQGGGAGPGGPPGGGDRPRPRGPPRDAPSYPPPGASPRKRMMSQGRKTHFVYDASEALSHGKMPENERRSFIESVFSRGSRQSTMAARQFIAEKFQAEIITKQEHDRLTRLVEQYSMWR